MRQLQDPDAQQTEPTLHDPQLTAGRLLGGSDWFPSGALTKIPSCSRILPEYTTLDRNDRSMTGLQSLGFARRF